MLLSMPGAPSGVRCLLELLHEALNLLELLHCRGQQLLDGVHLCRTLFDMRCARTLMMAANVIDDIHDSEQREPKGREMGSTSRRTVCKTLRSNDVSSWS